MRENYTKTSALQTKAELEGQKAQLEVCCTFERANLREKSTGFEWVDSWFLSEVQ
jgi:hypothetical protein